MKKLLRSIGIHIHEWSKWQDDGVINYYWDAEYSGSMPYKKSLRQIKRCTSCNKVKTRRVDY